MEKLKLHDWKESVAGGGMCVGGEQKATDGKCDKRNKCGGNRKRWMKSKKKKV